MRELLDYTERRTRAAIARLPQGIFTAEGSVDNDGFTDQPVHLSAPRGHRRRRRSLRPGRLRSAAAGAGQLDLRSDVFGLRLLRWCLQMATTSKEAKDKPEIAKGVQTMLAGDQFLRWASRTPWKSGQTPLSSIPTYEDGAFQLFFENNDYNDFWRQPGLGMDEHFDVLSRHSHPLGRRLVRLVSAQHQRRLSEDGAN